MTPEQFTYWLQGFFELSNSKKLDEKQIQIIKDHLDLVFNKVTPDRLEASSSVDMDKIKKALEKKDKQIICSSAPQRYC